MMKFSRYCLMLSFLIINSGIMGQDFCSISGIVKSSDGELIQGVLVSIDGHKAGTLSGRNGTFVINNVVTGNRSVQFTYKGFIPKQLLIACKAGENYSIDVVLEKDYFLLGAVTVNKIINKGGEMNRLDDLHETYIIAGRKNEVVQVDGINANVSEKTGRQIFAKIPGTFVYDMDGSGNQMNIATRGLDPHRSWEYNVRQNGVMTNSDIYGYPASHYSPPLESVQKVEIVRGTASLQYGASFGGMINYVTKSPDTSRKVGFENISSVGSYGLMSTYNAIGGKVGKLTYYAYMSSRKSDGYRENAQSDYHAQYAGISYAFSPNIKVKAELGHMEYVYQIPGPLTDSMFKADPRQSTRSRNYFNPDIYVPALSFEWKISDATRLSVVASGVLGKRNSVQFVGFATVADTMNINTGRFAPRQVDIDGFNSYTSEIRLLHKYRFFGFSNVISAGARFINNKLHRRQLGTGTTGNDYTLELSVPGFGRDLHLTTRNIALSAENMFAVNKRLSLTPGVRFESGNSAMSGIISYYDPGNVPNEVRHRFPLFGVTSQYLFDNGSRLYAGWAQAYRPVLFADIIPATSLDSVDRNLKDAKGHTFELGINGKLFRNVKFDIGLFAIRYNDRLSTLIQQNAAGDNYIFKTNVGNSITKGVEIFIEAGLSDLLGMNGELAWSVFTSSSYMDAHYQKGMVVSSGTNKSIAGNKLETVPRWISRNGLNISYHRFNSTIQYSYVSESFSDALNTREPNASGSAGIVPAYSLLDINASYRFSQNITLRVGLNNAFDKQYFTKRPTGYPGPGMWPSDGRSLVATVQIRL